jgi:hypothetical protein
LPSNADPFCFVSLFALLVLPTWYILWLFDSLFLQTGVFDSQVNASPSLSTTTDSDRILKTQLLDDIFSIVFPPDFPRLVFLLKDRSSRKFHFYEFPISHDLSNLSSVHVVFVLYIIVAARKPLKAAQTGTRAQKLANSFSCLFLKFIVASIL